MPEGFCEQCNGKCCTEFTVYVTHADIKRLVDLTDRDPLTFVTPYADDSRATYPLIKLAEYEVRLGLTYADKKCNLLKVDEERRRCSVQSHKPMVCRTYPFSLDDNGRLVHVEPYKCPGPIWPEGPKAKAMAESEVRALHREYREYESLVKDWNSMQGDSDRDLGSFLRFAFSRMGR